MKGVRLSIRNAPGTVAHTWPRLSALSEQTGSPIPVSSQDLSKHVGVLSGCAAHTQNHNASFTRGRTLLPPGTTATASRGEQNVLQSGDTACWDSGTASEHGRVTMAVLTGAITDLSSCRNWISYYVFFSRQIHPLGLEADNNTERSSW